MIPYGRHDIDDDDVAAVVAALRRGIVALMDRSHAGR